MKIINVQKEEGLPCDLCNELIKKGEEAFQYFNSTPHSGRSFELHWRHLLCSYQSKSRNISFKEYVDHYREIQKKKECIKKHNMFRCSHCRNSTRVFPSEYALRQHVIGKHGY